MKKNLLFCARIIISGTVGLFAALFADSLITYKLAFAAAYFFAAISVFLISEHYSEKLF